MEKLRLQQAQQLIEEAGKREIKARKSSKLHEKELSMLMFLEKY